MAEKQLQSTLAAAAFQKQWFGDLRRRVFDERRPYALKTPLDVELRFKNYRPAEVLSWMPGVERADAHSVHELGNVRYAVGTLRKGWASPEQVLNTLPVDEFVEALRDA